MKKRNIKQVALAITLIGVFGNAQAIDLFGKQKKKNEKLFDAISANNKSAVFNAINNDGAKVNSRMNIGMKYNQTPLTYAASLYRTEIVKNLISKGANLNDATKDGTTALMMAAESPHGTDIVKFLILAGADKNKTNKKGQTALAIAKSKKNTAVVDVLTRAGAK